MGTFTYILAGLAGLLAVVNAGLFFAGQPRPPGDDKLVKVLAGALVARAMLGIGLAFGGDEESQSITHIAYLVVSAALLPLVFSTVEGDRGRWSCAVFAVALLVVVVLMLRVQATG